MKRNLLKSSNQRRKCKNTSRQRALHLYKDFQTSQAANNFPPHDFQKAMQTKDK